MKTKSINKALKINAVIMLLFAFLVTLLLTTKTAFAEDLSGETPIENIPCFVHWILAGIVGVFIIYAVIMINVSKDKKFSPITVVMITNLGGWSIIAGLVGILVYSCYICAILMAVNLICAIGCAVYGKLQQDKANKPKM